jgi:hypothetical protein
MRLVDLNFQESLNRKLLLLDYKKHQRCFREKHIKCFREKHIKCFREKHIKCFREKHIKCFRGIYG